MIIKGIFDIPFMILIISDISDKSTSEVIDWLIYTKQPFIRINGSNEIDKISMCLSNEHPGIDLNSFHYKGIDLSSIKSHWYRRGNINIENDRNEKKNYSFPELEKIDYIYDLEKSTINNFFLTSLYNDYKGLNSQLHNFSNKILHLKEAINLGINIPNTIISNELKDIIELSKNKKVITKSLSFHPISVDTNDTTSIIRSFTSILDTQDLVEMDQRGEKIGLSFVQEYVEKEFEIRTFYLDGDFYSMAIFSQLNDASKTDFRKSNGNNNSRCVPFNLPKHVEIKLHDLMSRLSMNCGSIDMIFTTKGEYCFLEVNPIGQFDWLSKDCNYMLEKEIATWLTKKNADGK